MESKPVKQTSPSKHDQSSGRGLKHPNPNLPPLTSLRYFAALAIVCLHNGKFFGWEKSLARSWGALGFMGFFFILSGFILFYTHPVIEPKDRKKFYLLRFARIYPLFFVTTIAAAIMIPNAALFEAAPETWQILAAIPMHLTLTQAWLSMPGFYLIFNAVSWSISVECFFYIVFPFILQNFRQYWKRWLAGTYALTVCLILGVDFFHLEMLNDNPLGHTAMGIFHTNPLARLSEFVTGMALAYGLENLRASRQANVARPVSVASSTLLEIFAVGFLILNLSMTTPLSNWMVTNFSIGLAGWIFHSGALLASALTIFVFALNAGLISKLLSLRPFVFLGELSFSLYLWHNIFFQTWREGTGLPFAKQIPLSWRFVTISTFFTIVSYISFRFIEKPAKKFVMTRFSKYVA